MKKSTILFLVFIVMLIVGISFVYYFINHPEKDIPWPFSLLPSDMVRIFYLLYLITLMVLPAIAITLKIRKK